MTTDFAADQLNGTIGDPDVKRQMRAEQFEQKAHERASANAEKGAEFIEVPARSKVAKDYEQKTSDVLRFLMSLTAQSPKTVADAAALISYGDSVSEKMGDLAEKDIRVRRAIDFINGGTDNPYLDVAIVTLPLVLQILRNHEPEVETSKGRTFKIFGREFTFRLRFKVRNRALRSMTHEPKIITADIFGNAQIMEALKAQGINVAYPS